MNKFVPTIYNPFVGSDLSVP